MYEHPPCANIGAKTDTTVSITLKDGTVLNGRMRLDQVRLGQGGSQIGQSLNGAGRFIEFSDVINDTQLINVDLVASVRPLRFGQESKRPSASSASSAPSAALNEADDDPHAVLGIKPGATPEAIRRAYIENLRAYHPDRYAGIGLPAEMAHYVTAMSQRINQAYQQLAGQAA